MRSNGRFKPSSVASYERGERQISLERLFAIAHVYDVPPDRIVTAISHALQAKHQRTGTEGGRTHARPSTQSVEPFAIGGHQRS